MLTQQKPEFSPFVVISIFVCFYFHIGLFVFSYLFVVNSIFRQQKCADQHIPCPFQREGQGYVFYKVMTLFSCSSDVFTLSGQLNKGKVQILIGNSFPLKGGGGVGGGYSPKFPANNIFLSARGEIRTPNSAKNKYFW